MLDPWFKSLWIVENLVGCQDVIRLVPKYDLKVVIPFFMTCFETLNPIVEACTSFGHSDEPEDEHNIFGVGTCIEESSWTLVIGKLSLFKSLCIPLVTCEDPFAWWHNHEE